MDPLSALLQIAFYALFGVSVWRYYKRRGPLELAVVAVFGPIVALFVLGLVNTLDPDLAPYARPVLIAVLFAQPYFVVRLADQIRPVPERISRLVLLGGVLCTLVILLVPSTPLISLAVVAYFFGAQAIAAARLLADSRRRVGVARARLAIAALATALFGLAILLAGAASAANGGTSSAPAQILTRFIALIAAAGYLVAFLPPAWLLRMAHRAQAFDLVRNLVAAPEGSAPGQLWADLATSARSILGARSAHVLAEPAGLPLATAADLPGRNTSSSARPGTREPKISRVEIPLRGTASGEQLVAEIEGNPLFVEDDTALIVLLGSMTARAVDREEALIGLGEARRAFEESAAIRASEARFRALLEADPNAILALDQQDDVIWATHQAAELFGGSVDELTGKRLGDLIAAPRDLRSPLGAADERGRVFRAETTGHRLDGTHFPAEIARTGFELDGQPFQLAVVSDVSWRQAAAQIRDRFLGVLSHELRTPVTSIYGGTQLLLGRGARLDEETRTELLVGVAAESERLQRMIENLVALARIERGAEFAGGRPVLLDRVIGDIIRRERQLWPDLSITLEIPSPVQMVEAEEEYIAQIVRNLISNAAKYGGPGSKIEVELTDDSDAAVAVRVRDNGPGLGDEDADKLFSLYYRSATHAAVAPGAGIGLFICRELVTLMGGRIWATSRADGGAEFGFTLPAYVDEPDPSYESPVLHVSTNGNGTSSVNGMHGTNGTSATNGSRPDPVGGTANPATAPSTDAPDVLEPSPSGA